MSFGSYFKALREHKSLSQRQLADLANISNTEVSRIESGERQKPSPLILKVVAPHLGVSYTEMMVKAGYIEEVAGNEDFAERVFRDDRGKIVDIGNRYSEMYEKDSEWADLAYRVCTELDDNEIALIQAQTLGLFEQLLKLRKTQDSGDMIRG